MSILELNLELNARQKQGVSKSRLKLTRKGKVVVSVVVLAVLTVIVAIAFYFLSSSNASASTLELTSPVTHEIVTVKAGDNLWTLVADYASEDVDLRDYLLLVQEINDLDSAVVHPGQRLSMPIY